MNYILLLISALMWSFVSVMVKSASTMVSSNIITFCRFFFGVVFLGVFLLIKDKKISLNWKSRWIWLGAIGKTCNYVFENIAISMGFAYGNVIVWPVQAVFLTFMAAFVFKEKIQAKKIISVALCVAGVVLVSWNGASPKDFFSSNLLLSLLFALSAIGAGIHVISQKKLIEHMDSGTMNFSMFLMGTLFTIIPIPFNFRFLGEVHLWPLFSLICLGFITGISFYIYAKALKKTSLLVATIVSNSSVIFVLLWSWLFLKENVNNAYILTGVSALTIGMIFINIPDRKSVAETEEASLECK